VAVGAVGVERYVGDEADIGEFRLQPGGSVQVEILFARGVGSGFIFVLLRYGGEHDEAVNTQLAAFSDFFDDLIDPQAESSRQAFDGQARIGLRHQEDGLHEVAGGEFGFANLGTNGGGLAVAAGAT